MRSRAGAASVPKVAISQQMNVPFWIGSAPSCHFEPESARETCFVNDGALDEPFQSKVSGHGPDSRLKERAGTRGGKRQLFPPHPLKTPPRKRKREKKTERHESRHIEFIPTKGQW